MTEPTFKSESELIRKDLLLPSADDLEAEWQEEIRRNMIDDVDPKELSICICKHCGGVVVLSMAMQHLKLMHPEPYVAVASSWERWQIEKYGKQTI